MRHPAPKRALITGASGSIGAELAHAYAAPGTHILLQGRRHEVLESVAAECQQRGSTTTIHCVDLRDAEQIQDWITQLENTGLPDLVIANAGVNRHPAPNMLIEQWPEASHVLDVNTRAPIQLACSLLPRMAETTGGRFVFIGSLAAWYGLPETPTYSASKAAIKAYVEALQGIFRSRHTRVTLVLAGYVKSDMESAMPGPKPGLMDARTAAQKIKRGVDKGRRRIAFPFLLALGTHLMTVLPPILVLSILRLLGYGRQQ